MNYPGGKNGGGAFQKIINQIPPHEAYFEPFLGSGAVMRHKKPASLDLGIDLDAAAVRAFAEVTGAVRLGGIVPGLRGQLVAVGDALDFLENWKFTGQEFIYLDPPYLRETRRNESPIYRYEFWTEREHRRLLELVTALDVPVAMSGYASSLYSEMLSGWRRIEYQLMTRGGLATECLWMNYPVPKELHDYRYLGTDRIDRQRIKRKKQRWKRRLASLPELERYAILSAFEEWLSS